MYYRNAQAAVVVYDVTKAVSAPQWLFGDSCTNYCTEDLLDAGIVVAGITRPSKDLGQGVATSGQPKVSLRCTTRLNTFADLESTVCHSVS